MSHQDTTNQSKQGKRARLDETISPRGDNKKQRTDAPTSGRPRPTSYASKAASDLTVAITNERTGHLTQLEAKEVETKISMAIIREAIAADPDVPVEPPAFAGKPAYMEGHLKLWCCDSKTKSWLQLTIEQTRLNSGDKLVGKREDEMIRKVRCGILIPTLGEDQGTVGRVLHYQNPWAEIPKWTLQQCVPLKDREATLLLVSIPESAVPAVMERDRRLNYCVGSVYIRFQHGGGRFRDVPFVKGIPADTEGAQGSGVSAEADACRATPAVMDTDTKEDTEDDFDCSVGDILVDTDEEDGCLRISRLQIQGAGAKGTSTDGSAPL